MPEIQIRPLDAREFVAASQVLSVAFQHDALWACVVPNARRRPKALRYALEERLEIARVRGVVEVAVLSNGIVGEGPATERELLGVALWHPPGKPLASPWLDMFLSPYSITGLWALLRGVRRLKGASDCMKSLLPAGRRFWHLESLGIALGFQGRGIGSALLARGQERARHDSVGVFVIASQASGAFYRKHGFRDVSTCDLGDQALTGLWWEEAGPETHSSDVAKPSARKL